MKKVIILILFAILLIPFAHASYDHSHHDRWLESYFNCHRDYQGYEYFNYPGYYIIQYIRIWIPPRQIIINDAYGNRIITTQPGYYELHPIKIRVRY